MTRWKREETTTLILMHAHNRWSRWLDALVTAAESLGLPIGQRSFQNCNDRTWDREVYTSAPALARVGGLARLREVAAAALDAAIDPES